MTSYVPVLFTQATHDSLGLGRISRPVHNDAENCAVPLKLLKVEVKARHRMRSQCSSRLSQRLAVRHLSHHPTALGLNDLGGVPHVFTQLCVFQQICAAIENVDASADPELLLRRSLSRLNTMPLHRALGHVLARQDLREIDHTDTSSLPIRAPLICIRQLLSHAVMPLPACSISLSSSASSALDTSAFFTAKVPPKP